MLTLLFNSYFLIVRGYFYMSSESTEVLLARLEERLRTVFENQERESKSRDRIEHSISSMRDCVQKMDGRLMSVEESLAKSEPTIEEFITIKHKVVGAGIMGKWIWAGAGAIIGVLAAARREIFTWFAG